METILSPEKAFLFLGVLFGSCVVVIGAIMLDLWDGVYTARKTNQLVHSHKLRVTIQKMAEYFRFLLIGFLVDCFGFLFSFYPLPIMAILFGVGLIVVEVKSMFEHAHRRKSNTTNLTEIAKKIVECVDEKNAKKIIDYLSEQQVIAEKK